MKFMVAFDSLILYPYFRLVNFFFSYWISIRFGETIFFSKELSFLRNNISFLTNLSIDQTDQQFQISNLV